MRLRVNVHDQSIDAPTEQWVAALVHILSPNTTSIEARVIRVMPGAELRPLKVELQNGDSCTEPAYAWIALVLRRLSGSAVREVTALVHRRMVQFSAPKADDAITVVTPGGETVIARPEEWIASILSRLSADVRRQVFMCVQGHKNLVETPGRYVLHAERFVMGISV